MGDIKKKRKTYTTPMQLYDKERIEEENKIVSKYGLKNKKEIWKVESRLAQFRRRAKNLIPKEEELKKEFFEKLNKLGLKVSSTADVLGLTKEDLLDRRLQTLVFKKGFASSVKQARQLIVHKHIRVGGVIVNAPSFWVTTQLENKIELIVPDKKEKVEEKTEDENKEETSESGDEINERVEEEKKQESEGKKEEEPNEKAKENEKEEVEDKTEENKDKEKTE